MVAIGERATASPGPVATRFRPPGWRDGRLLVGLVLVLASVVVGARLVATADRTVPVFAARRTLPTGTAPTAADLVVVHLRLTGTRARYLAASSPLPAGTVLDRTVGAGEVVPGSALVPASALRVRPVAVPVDGPVPAGVSAGALVDVWAAPKSSGVAASASAAGADDAPERIAGSAEVFRVQTEGSGIGAGTGTAVQVLIEQTALPQVLSALARDDVVTLLPVPGSAPDGAGR